MDRRISDVGAMRKHLTVITILPWEKKSHDMLEHFFILEQVNGESNISFDGAAFTNTWKVSPCKAKIKYRTHVRFQPWPRQVAQTVVQHALRERNLPCKLARCSWHSGTQGCVFWNDIHWQIQPKLGPTENIFRTQLGSTESPFPAFQRQGMEWMVWKTLNSVT